MANETKTGLGSGNNARKGRKEECVCLNCGTRIPHQTDMPCYTVSCPQCGSKMATTKARAEDLSRRA